MDCAIRAWPRCARAGPLRCAAARPSACCRRWPRYRERASYRVVLHEYLRFFEIDHHPIALLDAEAVDLGLRNLHRDRLPGAEANGKLDVAADARHAFDARQLNVGDWFVRRLL